MAVIHFQCPECGFGDFEVGHLTVEADIYCIVCLEEQERQIRVHRCDEQADQARFRDSLAVA